MAYAVWASRIMRQPILKATLDSGPDVILTSKDDSKAFMQVYNSLGEELDNQCEQQIETKEIVWHLPACMNDGSISTESSIALIRTYLLLKCRVPLGVTRSSATIAAFDAILPFEYAQFMNFWLERHYALQCLASNKATRRPPYKIVIEGVDSMTSSNRS
jgi:hypothetical protein